METPKKIRKNSLFFEKTPKTPKFPFSSNPKKQESPIVSVSKTVWKPCGKLWKSFKFVENKVETTLLYIQLAETIFKETKDKFTVKIASTPEEIKALLEVGFEFVCKKDDLIYFRKRK